MKWCQWYTSCTTCKHDAPVHSVGDTTETTLCHIPSSHMRYSTSSRNQCQAAYAYKNEPNNIWYWFSLQVWVVSLCMVFYSQAVIKPHVWSRAVVRSGHHTDWYDQFHRIHLWLLSLKKCWDEENCRQRKYVQVVSNHHYVIMSEYVHQIAHITLRYPWNYAFASGSKTCKQPCMKVWSEMRQLLTNTTCQTSHSST